jgi:hypothetical protein
VVWQTPKRSPFQLSSAAQPAGSPYVHDTLNSSDTLWKRSAELEWLQNKAVSIDFCPEHLPLPSPYISGHPSHSERMSRRGVTQDTSLCPEGSTFLPSQLSPGPFHCCLCIGQHLPCAYTTLLLASQGTTRKNVAQGLSLGHPVISSCCLEAVPGSGCPKEPYDVSVLRESPKQSCC